MPQIIPAGAPNILGNINIEIGDFAANSGALYIKRFTGKVSSTTATEISGSEYKNIGFDASHSNSIFGNSETIQPPTISLLPQIKF